MRLLLALEILGAVLGAVSIFGSLFIWLFIGSVIMGVN